VSWQPALDVTRIVVGGQMVAVVVALVLRSILRRRRWLPGPPARDLRDYPLPFFDQAPPARTPREYPTEDIARLGRKLDEADGFVVLTAEYNHGYPAVVDRRTGRRAQGPSDV